MVYIITIIVLIILGINMIITIMIRMHSFTGQTLLRRSAYAQQFSGKSAKTTDVIH